MSNLLLSEPLPLSKLPIGQKAFIDSHEAHEFELLLMEMGCVPNELVTVEMIAPMGDPIAIHILGYTLSIRKSIAESIKVRML